jgi:hypothetical protein
MRRVIRKSSNKYSRYDWSNKPSQHMCASLLMTNGDYQVIYRMCSSSRDYVPVYWWRMEIIRLFIECVPVPGIMYLSIDDEWGLSGYL